MPVAAGEPGRHGRAAGHAERGSELTGSSLAPVIIPIVAVTGLAIWLMMVFRADSHPGYRHHVPAALPAFLQCCGAQDYAWFSGSGYA